MGRRLDGVQRARPTTPTISRRGVSDLAGSPTVRRECRGRVSLRAACAILILTAAVAPRAALFSPPVAAQPSPTIWGIDTTDNVQQDGDLGNTQAVLGGFPQFVGRYLVPPYPDAGLSSAEAQYILGSDADILLIDSPNQGFTNASADAQAAISQARALGVPAGTAIFRDVEASSPITTSYILGFYDAFQGSGYVPAFYENPGSSDPFTPAYCAAYAQNSGIATMPLWSSEPELESYTPYLMQAPAWGPETPSCANTTVAWQYLEQSVNPQNWPPDPPNVDVDEMSLNDEQLLWGYANVEAAVRGNDNLTWVEGGVDSAAPVFSGPWLDQGGGIIETPAVVSVPNAIAVGTPLYVVTGTDHDVWVSTQTGVWAQLSPTYAAYCTDAPAAAVMTSPPGSTSAYTLVVACRGTDGALWWASGPVSAGTLPSDFTNWASLGGSVATGISGGPAVAVVEPVPGTMISFNSEIAFFINGTDGRVYTTTAEGGAGGWTPTGWECTGHLAAASVALDGNLTTAFACQGTDHSVWAATTIGDGWDTHDLGGIAVDGPGIALSSVSWTVVVEGTDQAMFQDTSTSTTGSFSFGGWSLVGGTLTNGAAATALLSEANVP